MNEELLTLHGLAVKKAGSPEAVAGIVGLAPETVSAVLSDALAQGLVIGARGTYMLTPMGNTRLAESYPVICKDVREDEVFVGTYERFEVINRKILALFTAWQTVKKAGTVLPNDHGDLDYDNRIIDELGAIHERSQTIIAAFARSVPRFEIYDRRLSAAYDQVLGGAIEYVSGVRIDSYHTVWFEMHEDLLRLLGRTREEN